MTSLGFCGSFTFKDAGELSGRHVPNSELCTNGIVPKAQGERIPVLTSPFLRRLPARL